MVLHFLCFYGHPTLSDWFVSEYKKSGKKLEMGKVCVRFKSLDDLLPTYGSQGANLTAQNAGGLGIRVGSSSGGCEFNARAARTELV